MKSRSPEFASQQINPAFTVEQFPPEVFKSYDNDQIADLVTENLCRDGVDLKNVVFTGFDAELVMQEGSFGDRDETYAVGIKYLLSGDVTASAIEYLESNAGNKPAIGVFDLNKLVGGIAKFSRQNLHEISAEELAEDKGLLIFWATKNGASLDDATVKLFLF